MSFLVCQQLQKTYADGTEAVKGIDLACEEGELVVLLGPSGCGKTTTLRMIAGLEQPTGGQILLAGADITGAPPAERDVGFVFQFYALYPHLKVEENIAFPLQSMGMGERECGERVGEIVERLGLGALAGRYPRQLSGGDQQRVALARAMVRRPQIYLMDEPLGTLDADLRLEMRELIRAQQLDAGVTAIYVTHDQEEAMSLADRVVVMEGGKIRQKGPATEVYDRPADLFVAHFIGSPGMNFIAGQVSAGRFVAPGLNWALDEELRSGPLTLGVRPEFVRVDNEGLLHAEVVLDEYLGSSRNVHLQAECGRLVMRAKDEARFAVGAEVGVDFVRARTLFFDPISGERL
ncbi:MAG: ABC transporter ATP-binding protein [Candidatus Latescibacterota bacterium]|nr:ABC transporter ATP-binding protein [Candidatus Latescibacterota bacterium]